MKRLRFTEEQIIGVLKEAEAGAKTGDQRRLMLTQTIDQYQEAVDWAVGMADQMALPLEVVTVTATEYLRRQQPALEPVPC